MRTKGLLVASVSELNALGDEAVALIAAADWSGAKAKLIAAQAMLSILPDREHGGAKLSFDRESIAALLSQVRQEERASARGGRGWQAAGARFGGNT